jgi:hypothetical protein
MSCALKALADTGRRDALRSLCDMERRIRVRGEGTEAEDLRVLCRAGLLRKERRGRECRYVVDRGRIGQLASFLGTLVAEP